MNTGTINTVKMTTSMPSSMSDRQILEVIWGKIAVIDTINEKLDTFMHRLDRVEEEVKHVKEIKDHVEDLDRGVSYIETEFEALKKKVESFTTDFVTREEFVDCRKELIDLSNRQRRNNVVIYNVPEGSEGVGKDGDCLKFVSDFLKEEIGMDPVPHLQAAHRSGRKTQAVEPRGSKSNNSQTQGEEEQNRPRPIHVLCTYRPDKTEILSKAARKLKQKDTNIFFSDDVHPYTREVDRKLRQVMKDMRSKGWLAFIPWTVPRVIKYKSTPRGTKGPLKTYKLKEDFTA